MILYLTVIGAAMIVIAAVNLLLDSVLFGLGAGYIVLAVVANSFAVFAVDAILAFAIRRLPKKWFDYHYKFFRVSQREIDFLDFFRIRKWKDKVLELGVFTKFTKRKVVDPTSVEYVERFLLESNYGFVIHMVSVFLGFLIIFIYPLPYALMFGVPVAAVNAVLHLMPAGVLRYNIPRLEMLLRRNERLRRQKDASAA